MPHRGRTARKGEVYPSRTQLISTKKSGIVVVRYFIYELRYLIYLGSYTDTRNSYQIIIIEYF